MPATTLTWPQPAPVRIMLSLALAASLAACASTGSDKRAGDPYRDAIGAYADPGADPAGMDPVAAAAFWGTRYNRDQKDPAVAARYAAALRKIGSTSEAVDVASKAIIAHKDNPQVNLEAGKALVEAGRAFEAVRYLETAAGLLPGDWAALSAYGVALDQIGEHDLARAKYDEALGFAPNAAQVLNNKGLSYALSGDLQEAELTLRAASRAPGADARTRQNLALVLAIKGDMREAERLARSDLPPQVANQNIAYFRALLSQPAYWAEYAPGEYDAPEFSAPPAPGKPSAPDAAPSRKDPPSPSAPLKPMADAKPTPVTNASAEAGAPTPLGPTPSN